MSTARKIKFPRSSLDEDAKSRRTSAPPELCVESVEEARQRLANGHACVRLSCAAHPAAVPVGRTELQFLHFISFIRIESFKRLLTANNKFIQVCRNCASLFPTL